MRNEWVKPIMYVKLLSAEHNSFLHSDFNMVLVKASSALDYVPKQAFLLHASLAQICH